jgi:predicted dehydrogenase
VKSWWPPGHIIGYEHTFIHTVHDLLEAMADRKPVRPDFEDGVRNQKVLDAWSRSASKRRWEKV